FPPNTLNESEFHRFNPVFNILTQHLQLPNIIIFLDPHLHLLKPPIPKPNPTFQHQIQHTYLLNLKNHYLSFYQTLKN
uniref:deoxynucleoside kinase n=1 Tax=Staphylococcus hominis TaxID=1290 RepID=UPI001643BC84